MNFAWPSGGRKEKIALSVRTALKHSECADVAARQQFDVTPPRGIYPLYIAANIAPRVAMLVVMIVLTRLLAAEEYGLFVLVVTTGEILEMSWTDWIRIYLLRTEAVATTPRRRRLGRALALSGGGTLAALATSLLVVPFINADSTIEMMLAVDSYIAAFALLRTTLMLAQLSRSHLTFAAVECTRAVGILAATTIVAVTHPHSFLPTSIALSLATAGSATLGLLLSIRYSARPVLPRGGYLVALAFGVPFVLASMLLYTTSWFDRFVLNYFLGPAAVGVYIAAYSIARQPVQIFFGALNTFTFPLLVRAYAEEGAHNAGLVQAGLMTTMTVLGFGIVAGLTLVADPLTTLLLPASYHTNVVILMPWIAAATYVLSIKQFVFDNGLHVTQQNWAHFAVMIPPVLVSIGLSIMLVRDLGLFGAAINYVVVSVIATFSALFISFRVFVFTIPWHDLAKVALAALVAAAVSWGVIHHFAWGAVASLITATTVFCTIYGTLLTAFGFSLWRMIEMPWTQPGERAQVDRMSSNSAK